MLVFAACTRALWLYASLLCLSRVAFAIESQPVRLPVRAGHPRLLITADDIPRLQRQLAAYPEAWKRVLAAGLTRPGDAGYGDARALPNAALAFLITHEERYLASSVNLAANICRRHRLDTYASPEALFALALAYDWCYSGLTEPQRQEIRENILRLADYLRDKIWRHSDFNNHFVLEKVWPSTYAALALYGDSGDPRVQDYLSVANDYLHKHLLPAANIMAGDTGGQFEGYDYDAWGYMRPLTFVFEAWRTATGEDLFHVCTASRYDALWNIYGLRPFDHKMEHLDDTDLEHTWSQA